MIDRNEHLAKLVSNAMPVYKDWPVTGINYLNTVDICTDPIAFRSSIEFYYEIGASRDVDHVFAADARGFIWGGPVAYRLGVPLRVVRRKGKMPGDLLSKEYVLDNTTDILEVRNTSLKQGTALIVDDVLATGNTAMAICELVHQLGIAYENMYVACLVNIEFLGGKQKLEDLGVHVNTLIDKKD